MISIHYNDNAFREIMKGKKISNIEQDIMMKRLSQIQSEFLQRFGFEGDFELRRVDTNSKRSRTSFRIVPTSAKTTAALKREPGWLAKFL